MRADDKDRAQDKGPDAPTPEKRLRILLVAHHAQKLNKLHRRLRPDYDVVLGRDADEALDRIQRGPEYDMVVCALPQKKIGRIERELAKAAPRYLARVLVLDEDGLAPLELGRLSIVALDGTVIPLHQVERVLLG